MATKNDRHDDPNDDYIDDDTQDFEDTADEDLDFDPDDDYIDDEDDDEGTEDDDLNFDDWDEDDEDDEGDDDEEPYDDEFSFLDEDDDLEHYDLDDDSDIPEDDDEDDEDDYDDDYDDEDEDDDLDGDDPNQDDDVDPEVKRLRRENAQRRIRNRELQEQAAAAVEQGLTEFTGSLAKQLGIKLEDNDYNPETVAHAVQEKLEAERQRANQVRRDLAIYRAAGPAGADFDKLADSKTFTRAVDQLDPDDDDYDSAIADLVTKALDSNPEWKKPPTVTRSGGDFNNTSPAIEGDSIEALQKRRRNRRKIT